VKLVTGDTKVVDRGNGDGIYINTAGIGLVESRGPIAPRIVRPGDAVLLSGDIGRHGIAIMSAREQLVLESPIESDLAALNRPVHSLIAGGIDLHCLRDATRGGLATALVEIATVAGVNIEVDETLVPVRDDVRGVCEILGFDPLYVACEGRFIAFVPDDQTELALELLRRHPQSHDPRVIGTVSNVVGEAMVVSNTEIGGTRVLDMLSGDQLPRIC
jgi:hydrogenase expression/formation protein HypE